MRIKYAEKMGNDVKRKVFTETKFVGSASARISLRLIEKSQQKALKWINNNSEIEIIQIQTFSSSSRARTIIWYK